MDDEFNPPDKSIFVYYIEAINGEMGYQLRDTELTDLKDAQAIVIKIDAKMQDLGKSNFPSFTREKDKQESKGKQSMHDAYDKNIKELNEKMEAMEATYTNQLKNMQKRVVTMERSHSNRKKKKKSS